MAGRAFIRLPLILLAGLLPAASGMAAPRKPTTSLPPVCATASHERLLVRAGRDICGPTLSPSGRRAAAGFLPTACPLPGQTYRIDAAGPADRCITPIHPET